MKNKGFVPVTVERKRNTEKWHIDVSSLSLSELLNLREELKIDEHSIRVLDGIINDKNNIYVNNTHYYDREGKGYLREYKKYKKETKAKIKKKSKEKRGLITNDKHKRR